MFKRLGLLDDRTCSKILFVSGDCSLGTENDRRLTAVLGSQWRELSGTDQPRASKGSSPGYAHEWYWQVVLVAMRQSMLRGLGLRGGNSSSSSGSDCDSDSGCEGEGEHSDSEVVLGHIAAGRHHHHHMPRRKLNVVQKTVQFGISGEEDSSAGAGAGAHGGAHQQGKEGHRIGSCDWNGNGNGLQSAAIPTEKKETMLAEAAAVLLLALAIGVFAYVFETNAFKVQWKWK